MRKDTLDFFNTGEVYQQAIERQARRYYKTQIIDHAEMFIDYWTEEDDNGKALWETKKTFDVKKRFNTWLLRASMQGKITKHRI